MASSHTLDIAFDDTHAVANAGLLLPATLAQRLGIEQAADALIDLGNRPGAHRPGRKLLTLIHSMIAGGDCIDDADHLRGPLTPSAAQSVSERSPSASGWSRWCGRRRRA
jgi:hypothetical protein